jgi:hypothetical protein
VPVPGGNASPPCKSKINVKINVSLVNVSLVNVSLVNVSLINVYKLFSTCF